MTPPAAATRARGWAGTAHPLPRAPRRVSGPAARPRRGEDRARTARSTGDPLALRALWGARRLVDSRLLDRLLHGRLWIPLVAAGLMGIVFMQVTMLKLNAGIGRAVTSAGTLERQNQALRTDVSRMESGSRIDSVAHGLGMVVPADGTASYVKAAGDDQAGTAAQKMTAADPDAVARAKAGTALAAGQAAGTVTTVSATAAQTPAQAQAPVQAQAPATTAAATAAPTSTTASTAGTGTATGAGATTGTTGAATPPPAAVVPSAAATAPTQQQPVQQQPAQSAAAPPATTAGGAVAPAQG